MASGVGRRHATADEGHGGPELFLIELWPAGLAPLGAGRGDAIAGPLGDQPPLELSDRPKHVEDQLASR